MAQSGRRWRTIRSWRWSSLTAFPSCRNGFWTAFKSGRRRRLWRPNAPARVPLPRPKSRETKYGGLRRSTAAWLTSPPPAVGKQEQRSQRERLSHGAYGGARLGLTAQKFSELFCQACHTNKLVADDGIDVVRATIESGLTAGLGNPTGDLPGRSGPSAARYPLRTSGRN